jgi:putative DNA primase/helicase
MTPQELLNANGIYLENYDLGDRALICPHCSANRKPHHQKLKCLGVKIDDQGATWHCNHCEWSGPEKGTGNGQGGEFAATYDYRDAEGVLLFQKVRNPPGFKTRFFMRRPDGHGGWINNTKGVDTNLLYRLPAVIKAIAQGCRIACVEGEKDANNLWAIGIPATCNAHGASEPDKKPKWTKAHSEQLRGADIVVLNDNDPPGYAHADVTCRLSHGVAKRVCRLDLAKHWPDMPEGKDVSDWLAASHTREELHALIAHAPDYQAESAKREEKDGGDDDAEIERLAKLPLVEYERARKAAAEKLGVRTSMLEKLVKAKRTELGLDGEDGKQGHAIAFPDPEPWPDPVGGAALLDAISDAIKRHVILSEHSRFLAALWAVHTYLLDAFMITPRLAVRSPVKRCGKTTLLDVLARLAHRPLPAANISAAAVFRVVEGHRPCLLIDEADTFLRDNEELRGVLNSGHRRGGSVLRTTGDDHEPRSFATYAACVIALIGQLPGTLSDRSVTIDLKRRLPSEPIEPFRLDRTEHLDVLARQIARWSQDNAEAIRAADPAMPPGVFNRDADNLRPLLAIANVAGGEWPERAREAALAGREVGQDEGSRLELLLGDIRDIFTALELDRISSADLVKKLVEIEGRPWAEYGRSGKPLTQNRLARLLSPKPLAITPHRIRIGADNLNSYELWQFQEAFERYLSAEGVHNRNSGINAMALALPPLRNWNNRKRCSSCKICEAQ